METEATYDGKFSENILVVGQTGCGKTIFVQNLGKIECLATSKPLIWYQK